MKLKVAAYQGYALYDELEKNTEVIAETIGWAEKNHIDVLCFPECFLQGYLMDERKARQVSLEFDSAEMRALLKKLYCEQTTIILGVIEREGQKLYNTAIVVERGVIIGKYRKHFIHNKETHFSCGSEFPVFEKKGVKYGINICYDSRFPESAEALTAQGAQVIFCPLNNSLPQAKADEWKDKHLQYFIAKAKLSGCWIVSADVVEKSAQNTGYGCTCLVSPEGEVAEYLEHLKVGKFMKEIEVT